MTPALKCVRASSFAAEASGSAADDAGTGAGVEAPGTGGGWAAAKPHVAEAAANAINAATPVRRDRALTRAERITAPRSVPARHRPPRNPLDGHVGPAHGRERGYFFFGSREIVTLLIVTGVCGLSCMPVGTFAISWTTSTGAHSPKIV